MPQVASVLHDDYIQEIGPAIQKLSIDCSVIAGGSYSYKYSLISSLTEIRDLDLLIFVSTRENITDLLTVHQKDLDQILHLETVEKHFSREDLIPITQGYADAIRYSGINDLGQRISAKIIAYDQICSPVKPQSRINVLSKKDKRFYQNKTTSGKPISIGVVNQMCGSELCILGDPDLFVLGNEYSLGVISDVCLSGKIIHNSPNTDITTLKRHLIDKIVNICQLNEFPRKWSDILVRSDRLPPEFEANFNNQFPQITVAHNETRSQKTFIPQYAVSVTSPIIGGRFNQMVFKKKIQDGIREKRYIRSSGPFSSNSNYGLAVYNNGEKAFFKEMLDQNRFQGELLGLKTASSYFSKIRTPIYTEPDKFLISYDWYPGDILSRQRLDEVTDIQFKKIMEIELRKAEDHLNAYIRSAADFLDYRRRDGAGIYYSRINDLYYGRLIGSRLDDYYQNSSLTIDGETIPFEMLKSMDFVINGREYPSIEKTIELGTQYLNPDYLKESDHVCGLGDAHSGNIICPNNLDTYEYIDYEFAGFHSPYLDIAKQLYNDTAFNLFYSDLLSPIKRDITVKVIDGKVVIDHNYIPDKLSSYLYATKIQGIINPYQNYCRTHSMDIAEDWKKILGHALFCCGFLTRNISKFNQDDFLLNLANSIEATDFDQYSLKFTT